MCSPMRKENERWREGASYERRVGLAMREQGDAEDARMHDCMAGSSLALTAAARRSEHAMATLAVLGLPRPAADHGTLTGGCFDAREVEGSKTLSEMPTCDRHGEARARSRIEFTHPPANSGKLHHQQLLSTPAIPPRHHHLDLESVSIQYLHRGDHLT